MSKVKVYNKAPRTFLLYAVDNTSMLVRPNSFAEIPEKFTGDITYKTAVKAGDLQLFETAKQGDEIERAANEAANATKNDSEDTSAPETPSEPSSTEDNREDGNGKEAPEKTVATPEKPTSRMGKSKADDAE